MDCVLTAPSRQDRHETEELIEGQWRYTVTMDSETYQNLFIIPGSKIISVKKHCSVRLYCLCESLDALWELRKLFDSGQLKFVIAELFNNWLINIQSRQGDTRTTDTPVLLSHLSLIDYCQSEECFNGLYGYESFHKSILLIFVFRFFLFLLQNIFDFFFKSY